MALYEYGGIYDYLEDIHFPGGSGKFGLSSEPYFYYLQNQQPTYFSYLGGVWGDGWGARHILPVIKILAADTQPEVPTEFVGHPSLEAAADTYWQRWDQGNPLAVESFGRMNFKDKFFWKVLNRKFPTWASNLSGLATSRPRDPNPPIGPYIDKAMDDYFGRWNGDSERYNAVALGVPPDGGNFRPLQTHSFFVPFPKPVLKDGGTFKLLSKQISSEQAWFGPLPPTAWSNINLINTQSYAFTYGFGRLDPHEWDLSKWPPRRTSIPVIDGGSSNKPSAISGKWGGPDPFINFIDHQFALL